MIPDQYSENADCEIVRPTSKRRRPSAGLTTGSAGAREDPLNLVGRFQLALCLQTSGMQAQATTEFRRVLALDGNFWLAAYGLSITCALNGMLPALSPDERRVAVSLNTQHNRDIRVIDLGSGLGRLRAPGTRG